MLNNKNTLLWIKRIAIFLALAIMVYFTMMTVVIPVSRYKIILPEKTSEYDKVFPTDLNWELTADDSVKHQAKMMISEEAYLLSRLEMAESDSICLAMSFEDSTISLVIQGVTIYSSKIQSFQISSSLKKSDPFTLAQWLSVPFTVENHYSSIPKVPVLHKMAPKDTIEAMNQIMLDPLKNDLDPVFYSLYLDRRLILNFEQEELPGNDNTKQLKIYRREIKLDDRRTILKHLVRFSPIEFVPKINVVLDKKTARVIYRAIPDHALVSLQLPLNSR